MFLTKLPVKKKSKVLEIGPGSSPHYQSTVLVEKYLFDSSHRWGVGFYKDKRPVICADAGKLPFKNKSFDYIICRNILEHMEEPEIFIKENERVAKAGYIETPSTFNENLTGYNMHKLLLFNLNNELRIKKRIIPNLLCGDSKLSDFFLNDYHFKRFMMKNNNNFFMVKYFWKDTINYRIIKDDEPLIDFDNNEELKLLNKQISRKKTVCEKILFKVYSFLYRLRGKIEWEFQKFYVRIN